MLVGRETELETLARGLTSSRVVLIAGLPGVGKSALARRFLARPLVKLGHGRELVPLVVNLAFARTSHEVLTRLRLAMGETDEGPPSSGQPEDALARLLLAKKYVVLFDDADDCPEVVAHLVRAWQTRAGAACAIITMCRRDVLGDVVTVDLRPLAVPPPHVEEEAAMGYPSLQLLRRDGGPAGPNTLGLLAQIARNVDGLPADLVRCAEVFTQLEPTHVAAALTQRGISILHADRPAGPQERSTLAVWRSLTGAQQALLRQLAPLDEACSLEVATGIARSEERVDIALHIRTLVERGAVLATRAGDTIRYRVVGLMQMVALRNEASHEEISTDRAERLQYFIGLARGARVQLAPRPHQRIDVPNMLRALVDAIASGALTDACSMVSCLASAAVANGDRDVLLKHVETLLREVPVSRGEARSELLFARGLLTFGAPSDDDSSLLDLRVSAVMGRPATAAMSLAIASVLLALRSDLVRSGELMSRAVGALARTEAARATPMVRECRALLLLLEGSATARNGIRAQLGTLASDSLLWVGHLVDAGATGEARRLLNPLASNIESLSPSRAAWTMCMLACLEQDGGELALAREELERARRIARFTDDRFLDAMVSYVSAGVELELGNHENAVDHANNAITVFNRCGAAGFAAFAGLLAAIGQGLSGQLDVAVAAFGPALTAVNTVGRRAQRLAATNLAAILGMTPLPAPAPDGSPALWEQRLATRLLARAVKKGTIPPPTGRAEITISERFDAFQDAGGAVISLRSRPILRKLLEMLVRQRIRQPGLPVSPAQLVRQAWPEQPTTTNASLNRLYVSVLRLRELGLGDAIVKVEGGYLLSAVVPIQVGHVSARTDATTRAVSERPSD